MNQLEYVLRFAVLSAMTLILMAVMAHSAHANGKRHAAAPRKVPAANFCVNADSNPTCDAAFAAALQSVETTADVVVTAPRQNAAGPHGILPLRFQKRAPWVRRLETLGKEGIPFVRVPRGSQSELIVGINRKGVLGFELKQISNR